MKNTNEERSLNCWKVSLKRHLREKCLLIVEGASQDVEEKDEEDLFLEIQVRIQQGMKKNQAIKEVAKIYQWNKSQLYAAYHDWEENQEND